jgi:hypothetical protein
MKLFSWIPEKIKTLEPSAVIDTTEHLTFYFRHKNLSTSSVKKMIQLSQQLLITNQHLRERNKHGKNLIQ